jgi:hypothetical protein
MQHPTLKNELLATERSDYNLDTLCTGLHGSVTVCGCNNNCERDLLKRVRHSLGGGFDAAFDATALFVADSNGRDMWSHLQAIGVHQNEIRCLSASGVSVHQLAALVQPLICAHHEVVVFHANINSLVGMDGRTAKAMDTAVRASRGNQVVSAKHAAASLSLFATAALASPALDLVVTTPLPRTGLSTRALQLKCDKVLAKYRGLLQSLPLGPRAFLLDLNRLISGPMMMQVPI